jgi:membrane protein
MNEVKNFLENNPVIQKTVLWLKRATIPGFRRQPLFFVGRFFVRSMFDDDLILRASSLAFNFFLALFPTFIFFFTLIAYIPIDYLHDEIIQQLRYVMPHNAYETMKSTITDILKNQRGDLLSFGFVAAVFFASNGFQSMMKAFEKYAPRHEKRPWYFSRLRSIFITFLVAAILIVSVVIITYITITLDWLNKKNVLNSELYALGLQIFEYVSLFVLFYFIISSAYYFGSKKNARWSFFNTGSLVATLLSLATTLLFTFYVNQFNSYNKLYGSIGTLIGLMVLIYFNSIAVLIGFELNSSIDHAEKGGLMRQKKIGKTP